MSTAPEPESDPRFDEAEADVDRGESWRFRDPDAPNPLTVRVTGWSNGHTKYGPAEFLNGVDRAGKTWSVLVGGVVLKRKLIDGEVSEWDDERNQYVVVNVLGRAEVGEVVSLKYVGDRDGEQFSYPDFRVSRRKQSLQTAEGHKGGDDDDLPF